MTRFARSALIIIDLQKAIDASYHAVHGPRNNIDAESKIARLLARWRTDKRMIVHIRHDSTFPESAYRPGQIGNCFKEEVAPLPGETVIAKTTNNAFIGTPLEELLRASHVQELLIVGVSTNNSVEATVRMAGNLGFDTYIVADACFTFAKPDYYGRPRSADDVHAMSLANLDGEYCTVIETETLLQNASASGPR
jgi:nicotinamidase-related amidase